MVFHIFLTVLVINGNVVMNFVYIPIDFHSQKKF